MVSLDEAEKNAEFARSLGAVHVVLSDPLGLVAESYGVTSGGGRFAKRWTFYIDSSGVIREIDKNVRVGSAGQDIAANLERLGFPKAR